MQQPFPSRELDSREIQTDEQTSTAKIGVGLQGSLIKELIFWLVVFISPIIISIQFAGIMLPLGLLSFISVFLILFNIPWLVYICYEASWIKTFAFIVFPFLVIDLMSGEVREGERPLLVAICLQSYFTLGAHTYELINSRQKVKDWNIVKSYFSGITFAILGTPITWWTLGLFFRYTGIELIMMATLPPVLAVSFALYVQFHFATGSKI